MVYFLMLSNPVTARVLKAATHLKAVANFAVGHNYIDINTHTDTKFVIIDMYRIALDILAKN